MDLEDWWRHSSRPLGRSCFFCILLGPQSHRALSIGFRSRKFNENSPTNLEYPANRQTTQPTSKPRQNITALAEVIIIGFRTLSVSAVK